MNENGLRCIGHAREIHPPVGERKRMGGSLSRKKTQKDADENVAPGRPSRRAFRRHLDGEPLSMSRITIEGRFFPERLEPGILLPSTTLLQDKTPRQALPGEP